MKRSCGKCKHCNTYICSCALHKQFVKLNDICEDFEVKGVSMKDEEMAEEYARKTLSKDCCDLKLEVYKRTINSYLTGLHEGQKQSEIEVKELKILISSLVYEIYQIWDINEMNDDLRECAEKIEREVTLSKMADDNRLVISALGFAIVPPRPTTVDIKGVVE